jgi:simple sugar transport system permease protein
LLTRKGNINTEINAGEDEFVARLFETIGRHLRTLKRPLAESLFALFIGLLVGAALMLVFGHNPIEGYVSMLKGFGLFIREGFFDKTEFLEALAYSVPLTLTAITFAVGMRAGIFNIGAEGQVYLGAVAAAWIGGHFVLPTGIHVLVATAFAMLVGALWALLPAILKIFAGVHEVISSIMLNWIAFYHVPYLVTNYFGGPYGEKTAKVLPTAQYPVLGASLTAVIFVAIAACVVVYFLLWRTRAGYELRLVGDNPDAARYAGINIRRAILISFIIGGLAAGLAGASQVIGRPLLGWTLPASLGTVFGLGFSGIGVAVVGRNHPIGGIFAALLFAGMLNGAKFMEYPPLKIPSDLVVAIQGVIIMALAVPTLLPMIRKGVKKIGRKPK